MIHRRAIGSLIATGALLALLATPVAAGQICSLQATVDGGTATVVTVGEEVLIEGFGFFPGDVLVEYSVDATPLSSVTVTADATGAFTRPSRLRPAKRACGPSMRPIPPRANAPHDELRGGWRARHSHADADASSHTDARSPGGSAPNIQPHHGLAGVTALGPGAAILGLSAVSGRLAFGRRRLSR